MGHELAKKSKELKEKKSIKADIDAKISEDTIQQHSIFDGNPLYTQLGLKKGEDQHEDGTLFSISDLGVMDSVFSFMTSVDVAKLECTCKMFAIEPERGRKIALGGRCYFRLLNCNVSVSKSRAAQNATRSTPVVQIRVM